MDRIVEVGPTWEGPEDINLFVDGRPYFVLTFGELQPDDNMSMSVQIGNGMSMEENLELLPRALKVIAEGF